LDLNRFLVSHPESTFFAKVVGDSMIDVGIEEGDLLVIDRSIDPQDGHIVVAFLDGEFTLKFIRVDKQNSNQLYLVPANSDYPEILVTSEQQFVVWGVVTYSIKNRLKR
jgi:DNA polymerase V